MAMDVLEILHNMADHAETFHRFLGEGNLSGDLKERLIDHIILEEQENSNKLHEIHNAGATALTQKMLDHSYFLQKIMRDPGMPQDLKQELLHHFMEEHIEWHKELSGGLSFHETSGTALAPATAPADSGAEVHDADSQAAMEHYLAVQRASDARGTAGGARPSQGTHEGARESQGQRGHGAAQESHGGHGSAHGAHQKQGQSSYDKSQGHQKSAHGQQQQSHGSSDSKSQESSGWTVGPLWNQGE